jgi:hypothetical protein
MTNEVVLVQWSTKEPEQREFGSRGEAVRFVMEELEKTKRHNVRMIAEGAQFSFVDVARMYAGRKLYRRPRPCWRQP